MPKINNINNINLETVNSVLLYGNDEQVVLDKIYTISTYFKQKEYQIIDIDCQADKKNVDSFLFHANSNDFFSSNKLIICTNINEKSCNEILKQHKYSPECKSLFVFPQATSSSETRKLHEGKDDKYIAIPCYSLEKQDCISMIASHLKQNEISVENQAVIDNLYNLIGNNPMDIRNEMAKIAILCAKTKHIAISDTETIIKIDESAIFSFIGEFFLKNHHKALNHLENCINNEVNSTVICRTMYTHALKLLNSIVNIKAGSSKESEGKNQGIFFKQLNTFYKQLDIWTENELNIIIVKLFNLDAKLRAQGNFNPMEVLLLLKSAQK